MKIKNILITGSSGTIGTRLCERLYKEGYNIYGADLRKNIWNDGINLGTFKGDLRNHKFIDLLPKHIDMVIHLASNARVYDLTVKPYLAFVNYEILFNMLEFCRKNNINKFIFASSREVYGNSKKISHREKDINIELSESPYSASKLGGECLVQSYQKCYGIDFINLRFSNVYGMYDNSNRVVPLFIKLTKENRDLVVYGKNKKLDFTYIDDTVNGIIECIKRFNMVKNETFNIASGKAISILNVAKMIQKYFNATNKIVIKSNRTGEVVKFVANIDKAKEKLGYNPKVSIEEGIKKSIKWYMENVSTS